MWQTMLIVGIVFIILEIFTPVMFFLNLAFAAFITAIVSVYIHSFNAIILTFVGLSFVMLFILRPILMNLVTNKSQKTGIQDKYIGKVVKVVTPITKSTGAITIYGERWEARIESDEEIPEGSEVKIIRNESLVMFVEKV